MSYVWLLMYILAKAVFNSSGFSGAHTDEFAAHSGRVAIHGRQTLDRRAGRADLSPRGARLRTHFHTAVAKGGSIREHAARIAGP
jgi:hypothetical protein